MDEFLSQLFSDYDYSQDVPVSDRPEVQDAIARVLLSRCILSNYNVAISQPFFSGLPHIQRVTIKVFVRSELPSPLAPTVVWVDDFELAFKFINAVH
jgi:hypothetical protein